MEVTKGFKNQIVNRKEVGQYILKEYQKGRSLTEISNELNIAKSTANYLFKECGGQTRSLREINLKNKANENFFSKIDTEEKAYWLGFFYADGYIISKRKWQNYKIGIKLSVEDINHLRKFKKDIEYTGEVKIFQRRKRYYKNEKDICNIDISSNKLAEDLIKNGCVENKTLILKYPSKDIIPECLEKHFIRGLIDGDGCICIDKNKNFVLNFTGTKSMCEGVLRFFNKENIKLRKRFPERFNNNYSFNIKSRNQVPILLSIIYKDATVYLDRKYEKYLKMLELKSK